jgi:hypothetical protein
MSDNLMEFRGLLGRSCVYQIMLAAVWVLGCGGTLAMAQAHAVIGLGTMDAKGGGAQVGVLVPGGPAVNAGVKAGDVITAVNGKTVPDSTTLTGIVRGLIVGQTARLTITRGGQHLTIAVVMASSDTVGPTAPKTYSLKATEKPPANAQEKADAKPIAVSGYTTFQDPLEKAFTIQVPNGWNTVGGLARRAALQINPFLRSVSPDRMTYMLVGEPTLVGFVPPAAWRTRAGYPEGKLFDSGLGGLSMVLRPMSGQEFAKAYGQITLPGLCSNLKFTGMHEREEMAANADKLIPPLAPSISTGGEARFSCMHGGQPMEARIEAVTRATRDNVMWNVIFLKGFIAPASQAAKAEEILMKIGSSFTFEQAWLQKQSNLDKQAAAAINQNMKQFFEHERGVIDKLNASDENFSSMDDIVSGFSNYHDAATGNTYKLSNATPYKWTDESTGRIVSTQTDSPPLWGTYRSLPRTN